MGSFSPHTWFMKYGIFSQPLRSPRATLRRTSGFLPQALTYATMTRPSHLERTSADPREPDIHSVVVQRIQQANDNVRLITLHKAHSGQSIKFLPGQWLDVFAPGVSKTGGFTLTSTPREESGDDGYLELAIQKSANNPPAAWFWRDEGSVIGQRVIIRVGGGFVWPPPGIDVDKITRVVFVAGGVGINPLISILSHLHQESILPHCVQFLYSTRQTSSSQSLILFYDRLRKIFGQSAKPDHRLTLFQTAAPSGRGNGLVVSQAQEQGIQYVTENVLLKNLRISQEDMEIALGPVNRRGGVLAYVCGPPVMTDWAVANLRAAEGMKSEQVLCEKWW